MDSMHIRKGGEITLAHPSGMLCLCIRTDAYKIAHREWKWKTSMQLNQQTTISIRMDQLSSAEFCFQSCPAIYLSEAE